MTEPRLPFLVEPYSALAEVYDQAGFSDFARALLPHYLAYAQSADWAGRNVLDLGCGTGITSWWLADQGFRVAGIDNNPYMLAQAQQNQLQGDPGMALPEFTQMDIRQLQSPIGKVDLVVAAGGIINALQSLRDLGTVFTCVYQALGPDKLFIFDAHTIRGLAMEQGDCDSVQYDDGHSLLVLVRNRFSFETLSTTRHYSVFRRHEGSFWQRQDEVHTERGYPTQGITTILGRSGFETVDVLNTNMESIDIQDDAHARIIVVARKQG